MGRSDEPCQTFPNFIPEWMLPEWSFPEWLLLE